MFISITYKIRKHLANISPYVIVKSGCKSCWYLCFIHIIIYEIDFYLAMYISFSILSCSLFKNGTEICRTALFVLTKKNL